jgi:hypothetical protein
MSDTFPEKVKQEYLCQSKKLDESIPAKCPYCGAELLLWEFDEFVGTDEAKVRVTCEDGCGKFWFEYYTLTDIEPGSEYKEEEDGEGNQQRA